MDEQAKIIISIVFGVIGILSSIVIVCFIIWLIYRRKSKSRNLKKTSSISQQPQYQSSENSTSIKSNKNSRRKRNKRFNTNDSAISLSFNPPHLINQNVKNLDKLLSTDSISTTTPWPHEDAIPSTTNNDDRYKRFSQLLD
jgi:ABC-type bacteriocin/lantibiotic exporter with double-glycine peptidase domain